MKLGFREALAQAAAGIPPVPQAAPPSQEMSPLHEQLLASVQARETPPGPPVRTVPIVTPRQPEVERSYQAGAKSRQVGKARVAAGKRTVEELFGEEEASQASQASQAPADPRASDGEVPPVQSPSLAAQRWPHGKPLPQPCRICAGKGHMVFGMERVPCLRCGGSGEVPQVDLAKPYGEVVHVQAEVQEDQADQQQARVEAALAREVEVPLPWEGEEREGPTRVATVAYDLPTDLLELPAFCYVAGPAGTGKTWQAKAWAAGNPEGVILAATTGIAAVNLGEGTTINALLRYYNTASLIEAYTGGWLEGQFKRLRNAGLQRVVLDEVSMLSGDQLTILCRALDNVNADRGEAPELGLVLVGDFAQLAPVKEPFAFESPEWERFAKATYRLTTIRRQADQAFVEALQAIRRGDVDQALAYFGPRMDSTTDPHFDGTTILAKNDAVDKYNQLRLDKVPGQGLTFPSSRWGKIRSEWGAAPKPVREWGIPETLQLKVGALVMVLANRNLAAPGAPPEYLYVNGDLGVVEGIDKGAATVVLQRNGERVAVVPVLRDNVIPLEPGRRKTLKAEGHPERVINGKYEAVGGICYTPLRLAYASTVHKSQGLSLDRVQVNVRDHFFSQGGMVYVALSRARTVEGLRLVGTPEGLRARIKTDPKVIPWL